MANLLLNAFNAVREKVENCTAKDISEGVKKSVSTTSKAIEICNNTINPISNADFLVSVLIDNSPSIIANNNQGHLVEGYNLVLKHLKPLAEDIRIDFKAVTFYGGKASGSSSYKDVRKVKPLTVSKYASFYRKFTPLNGDSFKLLNNVLKNKKNKRTLSLIITDGAANDNSVGPGKVKNLIDYSFDPKTDIVAGMGITDGTTNFYKVFQSMGIKKEWIITPSSVHELERAFRLFASAMKVASKDNKAFEEVAKKGFCALVPIED